MASNQQSQIGIGSLHNKPPSLDPKFYRQNTFMFDYPNLALKWLRKLSPLCLTAIKTIRVFVSAVYNPGPAGHWLTGQPAEGPQWVAVFEYLAARATGLSNFWIYFDAERSMGHWGSGNDIQLVRVLGKLRTLETFGLERYFARDWPSYLRAETGCEVRNGVGQEQWYSRELARFQSRIQPTAIG